MLPLKLFAPILYSQDFARMNPLTDLLDRVKSWSLRLPSGWGFGHVEIHSSLIIALPSLAAALVILSFMRLGMAELRTAAVTLPLIWLISLLIRVAAQQLAIGTHSNHLETIVGPAGNLSTDHERLDGPVMFSYAIAGQMATASLIILGFVVSAAIAPVNQTALINQTALTTSELFDFKCGWTSRAWASQIMWLNLFIGSLHLLPTVPFDMRALVYACSRIRNRRYTQSHIYQTLASMDSHLSCILLGVGIACAIFQYNYESVITGWYGFIAAAVYLFVGGRWEAARAAEFDEPAFTEPAFMTRRDPAHARQTDSPFPARSDYQPHSSHYAVKDANLTQPLDVDEILRKLHREGQSSLSDVERQALLTASKRLKNQRDHG